MHVFVYIFSALSLLCVIVKLKVASGAKHGKTSSTNFEYRENKIIFTSFGLSTT